MSLDLVESVVASIDASLIRSLLEDRGDYISKHRMSSTKALVKRGLNPLDKTPSGKDSGEGDKDDSRGQYQGIDFSVPSAVAQAARKGLELRKLNEKRKALPSGDPDRLGASESLGGTEIGVARAVQLSTNEKVTPQSARRIAAYFGRHTGDKGAEGFGNDKQPSAGYVAWLLWGGDPAKKWAESLVSQMDKSEE